jgi:hypothetical protein
LVRVGNLVSEAPISGLARVIAASPEVALAIGYDIDQAFEEPDKDPSR